MVQDRLATIGFVFLELSLMCHSKYQEIIAAKSLFSASITWERKSGLGITA